MSHCCDGKWGDIVAAAATGAYHNRGTSSQEDFDSCTPPWLLAIGLCCDELMHIRLNASASARTFLQQLISALIAKLAGLFVFMVN